jgi:lipopolysaccharide export system permease protein
VNLLDRYIFRSVLLTCAGAVALLGFVLIVGNVVRDLLSYVVAGQLPLATFARLVWLLVPAMATYALPPGMLTGVLLTLGRLSADSEVTAMRAAGISLPRIARPVFILAALTVAGALFVNFDSMPRARVQYHRELAEAVRTNPLRFILPKTFHAFKGCVVYVGEKKGAEMRDIWVWKFDNDVDRRVTQIYHAETGKFTYDEAANELILVLGHAQIESRNEKKPEDFSEPSLVAMFGESEPFHLGLERIYGRAAVQQKLQWMTLSELRAEQERLAKKTVPASEAKQLARDRMKVSLTIHDKINTALAILSFTLMGVPLGIRVSRRETSANLGVAVMLALGYYFLTVMVGWLDRHPEYHPDLLLWIPNVVFLSLGVWMFSRIDRQ